MDTATPEQNSSNPATVLNINMGGFCKARDYLLGQCPLYWELLFQHRGKRNLDLFFFSFNFLPPCECWKSLAGKQCEQW